MSLNKIGQSSAPNIQQLKKTILHDALQYNIRQQQAKYLRKHVERSRQIEDYQLINRRVSTELAVQQQKQKQKKFFIRNILAHDYDKQIQERKNLEKDQVRRNRSYAQAYAQSQKEYHERRSRELARMYRVQKTAESINPQQSRIQRQRLMTQLYNPHPHQHQNLHQYQPPSNAHNIPQIQTIPTIPSVHQKRSSMNTPKLSQLNQSKISRTYKDYLIEEIQRKKVQKQQQQRNRLQLQKQISKKNGEYLAKQRQELMEIKKKQTQIYRSGLEEQIRDKRRFRNVY